MILKDPKTIIRNLFEKHVTRQENIIHADKLFIINSIVSYLFKDKHYTEIDKSKLMRYGDLINRYLHNEVDIFWKDGKLMVEDFHGHYVPDEE